MVSKILFLIKDVQFQRTWDNISVKISSDLHAFLEMASSGKKSKGVTKKLSTFLKWGKDDIIGYTVEALDNKQYVTKIWCKLCAKYRDQIIRHPSCEGAAAVSVKAFADGTPIVTKFQVTISSRVLYILFLDFLTRYLGDFFKGNLSLETDVGTVVFSRCSHQAE